MHLLVAELVQYLFACVVVGPLCSLFKTKTLFPSAVVFFSRSSVIRDVSGLDAKLSLPTFDMKKMGLHIQSITLLNE